MWPSYWSKQSPIEFFINDIIHIITYVLLSEFHLCSVFYKTKKNLSDLTLLPSLVKTSN